MLLTAAAQSGADAICDNLIGFDDHHGRETVPLFQSLPAWLDLPTAVAAEYQGRYNLGYLKPVVRREFLDQRQICYDESLRTGEDLLLLLDILAAGGSVACSSRATYIYTTPVGEGSRKLSRSTHTAPRDADLARALDRFAERHRMRLSDDDRHAVSRRTGYLAAIASISRFRHARLNRDWPTVLRLLIEKPEIRRHVWLFLRPKRPHPLSDELRTPVAQDHSRNLRTNVYVINLERSTNRRSQFEAHASACKSNTPWVYHKAHTELSSDLDYNPRDALIAKGRALYPAELGVYSSHHSVWKRFLNDGADQALILEDDVVIDWEFVEELTRINLTNMSLKYLKLFNKNITPYRLVSEDFCRRTLIDCRGFPHGMQAYMVTRDGAAHFVDFCRQVRRPIDDELDRSWAHGIPNVAVFPFPAFERHGPSTIGTTRYERHSLPRKLNLPRITIKFAEKIRRGWQRVTGYGFQSRYEGSKVRRYFVRN